MIEVMSAEELKERLTVAFETGYALREKFHSNGENSSINAESFENAKRTILFDQLLNMLVAEIEQQSVRISNPRMFRLDNGSVAYELSEHEALSIRRDGNLPLAASGELKLTRRFIRVSDVVLQGALIALSIVTPDIIKMISTGDCDSEAMDGFNNCIALIIATIKQIRDMPKVGPGEHCLFIKAVCYAKPFLAGDALSWYPDATTASLSENASSFRKCDIPSRIHWRCDHRKSRFCGLREGDGDEEKIGGILESLEEKNFLEKDEEGYYQASIMFRNSYKTPGGKEKQHDN